MIGEEDFKRRAEKCESHHPACDCREYENQQIVENLKEWLRFSAFWIRENQCASSKDRAFADRLDEIVDDY